MKACPKCNSLDYIKKGFDRGTQRYKCKNCGTRFVDNTAKKLKENNFPKILVLDIETAPLKAYVWSRWKQNIYLDQTISEWFMLTWAAKWLFDDEVYSARLTGDEVKQENDKRITKKLWVMLDDADFVITHNGDRFDIPKIKSRFLVNGLSPTTPYRSIDTKKVAAKQFGFSSNKLEGLARVFGLEGKNDTDFNLWANCMDGKEEALEYMETYNKQDIIVLEDVYLKIRPHIANHPNITLNMNLDKPACICCGSENIFPQGEYMTQVNVYTTYRCSDCGGIAGRMRKSEITTKQRQNILMPVAK